MTEASARQSEHAKFTSTMREFFRAKQIEIHTALPAIVVSYSRCRANVQITLMRKRLGRDVAIPVLLDVPVAMPYGGGSFIHFPIKAGDEVAVIFMERSIDDFIRTGQVTALKHARLHDLSDGFCFPIVLSDPAKAGLPDIPDDALYIRFGDGYFQLNDDGTIQMVNGFGDELIGCIKDLADVLRTATITGSSFSPATVTSLENVCTRLERFIP